MINCFLKLEGLEGECVDSRHPGWIPIHSFSWGVSQRREDPYGAPASPDMQDIALLKPVDKTSPDLALACAEGRLFPTASVEFASGDETHGVLMRYNLRNCLVSSVSPSFSGDYQVQESLSLAFQEIEWRYWPRLSDGSFGESIARAFNLAQMRKAVQDEIASVSTLNLPQSSLPTTRLSVQEFMPHTAFIVMAMDPKRPELTDVHMAIKEVCRDYAIEAVRADDIQHDEKITDLILERIRVSEHIIADLTGERPNVYYEVGHAHAIGKHPILVRRQRTRLHFDLAAHNVREYRNVTELREILVKRFEALGLKRRPSQETAGI